MKINKTIILSDIISIAIAFWLFIIIFFEMKNVIVINHRVLNVLFVDNIKPLKKISLGRSKCQETESNPLFSYSFLGIKENCVNNENNLINKKCDDQEGYKVIEEIPSQNLHIWRNKVICANYFDKNEIDSVLLINATDNCEEQQQSGEYKQCGFINTMTKKENIKKKFCIKKEAECPINYLNVTDDVFEYNEHFYTILPFEKNFYLVTSNKRTENSVILDVAVSEGDYPCYSPKRYSSTTQQFPGLNNLDYFNCSTNQSLPENIDQKEIDELIQVYGYDPRYIKFDTLPKENVLIDNDLDYLYKKLPNLNNWKQDFYTGIFSLFYKDSFMDKKDCKEYKKLEANIKKLNTIQSIRVLLALFHIILYVVLFSILGLMRVVFSWFHSLLFGIKVAISFIVFGTNQILIYYSYNNYNKIQINSEELKKCLDEVSQTIVNNYDIEKVIEELNELYNMESIIWYIYCFFNFIEFCRIIHKIYIRIKNSYRRNIAKREIGADNLRKIFEKVRGEIDKKKQKLKVS